MSNYIFLFLEQCLPGIYCNYHRKTRGNPEVIMIKKTKKTGFSISSTAIKPQQLRNNPEVNTF